MVRQGGSLVFIQSKMTGGEQKFAETMEIDQRSVRMPSMRDTCLPAGPATEEMHHNF